MTRVIVGNSKSKIEDLPNQFRKPLAMLLSYLDQGIMYATKNAWAARKYLVDKEGYFPTGLLSRVEKFLVDYAVPYAKLDNRLKPKPANLGLTQRCEEPDAYIEQHFAVMKCATDSEGRGVVVMPTGVGKSRVIKDLILMMDLPTLVVPPSANLKKQTFIYFEECFGKGAVSYYSKNTGFSTPIVVANIDSLESGKAQHFENVGMVLIDEFHHSAAATYRDVNEKLWSNVYYKFGFTATNFRNDPADQILLESVLSKEIYSMTPVEAIEKGYIVPIKPFIYSVENLELEDSSNYQTCYNRFIVENEERNKLIAELATKMIMSRIPTLVLVKQVEHGRKLSEMIQYSVFINGQEEDSTYNMEMVKRFNELKVPCMIGTSVIGEGVDTKSAGCVILANGEKATSRVMQNIGRVVRNFPGKKVGYVFDFYDHGGKFVRNHSNKRFKLYREKFGVEPIFVSNDPTQLAPK